MKTYTVKIHDDGTKEWWLDDNMLTQAQWKKAVKPKVASCVGKVVEVDGVKYRLVAAWHLEKLGVRYLQLMGQAGERLTNLRQSTTANQENASWKLFPEHGVTGNAAGEMGTGPAVQTMKTGLNF